MKPWELLGRVRTSGGEELRLLRRDTEYVINVDGHLLMTNFSHHSEDELARIACAPLARLRSPRVLVGGLGMGYTLAAALSAVGPGAEVVVAELLPEVVEWNWGPLAPLAGFPLRDKRAKVRVGDIADLLRAERKGFDAILQDVDNGPRGQTLASNDRLYSDAGLAEAKAALRPGGVLALWSAKPNKPFVKRLRKAGFEVAEHPVRGRDRHRGAHYVVWTAVPHAL